MAVCLSLSTCCSCTVSIALRVMPPYREQVSDSAVEEGDIGPKMSDFGLERVDLFPQRCSLWWFSERTQVTDVSISYTRVGRLRKRVSCGSHHISVHTLVRSPLVSATYTIF